MHKDEKPPHKGAPQPDYVYGYGYGYGPGYGSRPQDDLDDDFSLAQLIGVLRRNIHLILICAAIGALAAAEWAFRKPPVYTATVELLVEGQSNAFLQDTALGVGGEEAPRDRSAFETQVHLATSRAVLTRAADRLNLDEDPDFNPALPQPEREGRAGPIGMAVAWLPEDMQAQIARTAETVTTWFGAFSSASAGQGPDDERMDVADGSAGVPGSREQRLNLAARTLAEGVSATRAGRSQFLEVSYNSTDPVQAAEIANAIARSYIETLADQTAQTSREANQLLNERLEILGQQVREAEKRIERFRSANQLGSGNRESFADQQLNRLGEQLIEARAEATEKAARARFIRSLVQRGEGLDSVEEVANSPAVQGLREQERDIQREIATLSVDLGARHPRIVALNVEIEEIREKVLQEAVNVASNMETEARIARSKVGEIQNEIERAQQEATQGQDASVELVDLERDADAVRRVYETFLTRAAELQGRGDIESADAKIVTPALPPEKPTSRPPMLFVAIGFVLSGGAGYFLAFVREQMDQKLRDPRELEEKLSLPCFGAIPLEHSNERVIDLIGKPHSYYAESVRSVLSTYMLGGDRKPPRTLGVTSTAPGEGKSTFAASLAISAARMKLKVLLVDADFRRPTVATNLGLKPRAGLLEYLNEAADIEDVVEHVEALGLDVIVGSTRTDQSIELVTARSLADFVEAAKSVYDLIIFDSPPALGLADTNIVASLVDDLFYVVEWNAIEIEGVKSGLSALRSVEANVIGLILSKIDMKKQKLYNYRDFSNYYDKYKKYYS